MPNLVLSSRSALDQIQTPAYHGEKKLSPGVVISLRPDPSLATVMVRKSKMAHLSRKSKESFGIDLPLTPRRAANGPISFVWAGPGRWLAETSEQMSSAFEGTLRETFTGLASVTNQSDGLCIVRVSGPKVRDTLAKGIPLDLDPRAFGPDDVAMTVAAHINTHFWQIDATPSYDFAVFRSFAASFCEWLLCASAEFGTRIDVFRG